MLSASRPSSATSLLAAARIRSFDSWDLRAMYTVLYAVHRRMGMRRPTVRGLAWAAVAGQVLFVAAWIVAGALDRGYSHLEEGVSALGAKDAAHPLIMNAAIVVLGLSLVALAVAVYRVLPRRPAALVAAL